MKAKEIKLIHQGNFLNYYEILYEDTHSKFKTYEIASKQGSKHSGTPLMTLESLGEITQAVIMIVFNKDHSKILLNKEFRLGVNRYVYNTVAGLIDPGETAEEAAAREIFEETGLKLTKIIDKLPNAYTCAPVTDEFVPTFICEAEGEIVDSTNPVEIIHPVWCTKQEARKLLFDENCRFSGRLQAFLYMWSLE